MRYNDGFRRVETRPGIHKWRIVKAVLAGMLLPVAICSALVWSLKLLERVAEWCIVVFLAAVIWWLCVGGIGTPWGNVSVHFMPIELRVTK